MAISYRVEERINPGSPLCRIHQLNGLGQARDPRVVHCSTIPDVKDIQVITENRVNAPDKSECTQETVCTHSFINM